MCEGGELFQWSLLLKGKFKERFIVMNSSFTCKNESLFN
jgi:hypothetical protein